MRLSLLQFIGELSNVQNIFAVETTEQSNLNDSVKYYAETIKMIFHSWYFQWLCLMRKRWPSGYFTAVPENVSGVRDGLWSHYCRSKQMESRRMQWRTPKRIRMNIRQTNSRKLNLSCKKRKSKNCDMEEDGTKMSIVLTVQTGLSPGVCGPLKMAWRSSLGAWNKLTFTPVSSE